MPVAQLYAVVGDANVRRNMTQMNIASREAMGTAKVIDCSALSDFAEALRSVPSDTTVCLVQCLTSFLASAKDGGTIFGTVDPVLSDFVAILREFCAAHRSLQVVVAPPNVSNYTSLVPPELAAGFSSVFVLVQFQPASEPSRVAKLCLPGLVPRRSSSYPRGWPPLCAASVRRV